MVTPADGSTAIVSGINIIRRSTLVARHSPPIFLSFDRAHTYDRYRQPLQPPGGTSGLIGLQVLASKRTFGSLERRWIGLSLFLPRRQNCRPYPLKE